MDVDAVADGGNARRAAIIRLLQTRDEHLPESRRRAETPAGFVHRVDGNPTSCPDCLANGRILKTCETCHGRGYVEERRDRDPYAENKVLPYGFDATRHDAVRERDRQIETLDRQLAPPRSEAEMLEEANKHPFAWELARKRMYRLFDYGALDAALERLRGEDDTAYRALHAVHVYGWMPSAGRAADLCERGLVFLLAAMPEKVRAPGADPGPRVRGPLQRGGGAGLDARRLRDAELCARAAAGASPAELAQEFGVSVRTVYRVVNEAA